MTVQDFYRNIGGDYKDVLLRLPNDALVARFIKRFKNETSYEELMTAISAGDANASFEAAHKLKGIVANMSFKELYVAVSELTDQLRSGDVPADKQLTEKVSSLFKKLIDEIERFENEEG